MVTTRRLRAIEAAAATERERTVEVREHHALREAEVEELVAEIRQAEADREDLAARLAVVEAERDEARAQPLLTHEDQVALRALLRQARRQARKVPHVFVLYQRGRLHSLHATVESAEAAAEAEGPPHSGWTPHTPGEPLSPAAEVAWRICPMALGGAQ
ncbi:hypothetical protein E0L36_13885 [Streptomyces sp. AJS327]|uniref:hypothetical protein n=1 Tax=Streptomyces sp. AJS327 TaxID=2545265 RepID=UPI0015DFAAA4|nr:hypothetical protein [Streptomyces sp. AJS327]MBA0051945.1 hypothetical protein [Streptomyces sp. AJS327]